ncbi:cupin domain-containing protein [Azospirillum sp. sgz301742]
MSGNLLRGLPASLPEELFTTLAEGGAEGGDVRIERIVSTGHASPAGFWYDQEGAEFVLLIEGSAGLELEGAEVRTLAPGDWLVIAPHVRHRVAWTDPDRPTVWLAVHYVTPAARTAENG